MAENMWAYMTIKQLLAKCTAIDDPTEIANLNERAKELALKVDRDSKYVTVDSQY